MRSMPKRAIIALMPESSEENLPEGSGGSQEQAPADKTSDRPALWGAFGLLTLAFGFAAWQITRGTEATGQVAVFAVAITMVTALLQTSLPLHKTAFVAFAAFFATFVPISAGTWVYENWRSRQVIDAARDVQVDKTAQGMAIGSSTAMTVHLSEPRAHLRLRLHLEDHNPETGSCSVARQTTMRVRLNQNGNIRTIQESVPADQRFEVELGRRVRDIRLDVTLLNDYDHRCVMDLSTPFAEAW